MLMQISPYQLLKKKNKVEMKKVVMNKAVMNKEVMSKVVMNKAVMNKVVTNKVAMKIMKLENRKTIENDLYSIFIF